MSPPTYTADGEVLLSAPLVAERLTVSPSQVRRWAGEGRFDRAQKDDGGRWQIPASAVAAFAAGRRQRGRPRREEAKT